jgi:hypothetical protein
MSKCDLRIELDRQPPAYRPGEQVHGKLHVAVNDSCRCDALTVALQWRTHGKGNTAKGPEDVEPIGSFEWSPGEASSHPFTFTMPHGPVSYHGQIINVDWYLVARADVPWAIDPKAEQDILLLPAPPKEAASGTYRGAPMLAPQAHNLGPAQRGSAQSIWVKFVGVAFFLIFFFVFFGSSLFEAGRPNWMLLAFFCVFLFVITRMIWADVRNLAARRKLGEVRLTTDPPFAMRGQAIVVRAALVPLDDARLTRVTTTLLGEEIAVSGSGTKKTTHTHKLDAVEAEMSSGMTVTKGQPTELTCTLQVPADAAPTFRAPDNKVRWRVIVHFDIDAWPDLEETLEVDILPS